ncbi:MAG: GFA family protein, partial [Alphaproteobacteria bacterium]
MAPDPTAPDTGDDRRRSHQGLGRRQRGQCLCGAVVFTIDGPLRPVVTCHCHMCQRFHGGPGPYTAAETAHIRFDGDAPPSALTWHRSSDTASRGFCRTCGSSLFWRPVT